MVMLYVRLILNDARSFESVPPNLKAEVKAKLAELGYDENGQPLDAIEPEPMETKEEVE